LEHATADWLFFFATQVRYAATEIQSSKSARARGAYLRVSFKNTRETAQAINGWKLQRAVAFLENVKEHKEAVPMRRYAGSTGRTAQGTTLEILPHMRNTLEEMERWRV
jgi:ribosomal protein L22